MSSLESAREPLKVGLEAELIWNVGAEHVIQLGVESASPSNPVTAVVFSTPNMIMLMERAARKLLRPFLNANQESVGVAIQVEHLAATPIGAQVRGVAKVTAISEKAIDFEISAFDSRDQIGRGTHRRAIIPIDKFARRLDEKTKELSKPWVSAMQTTSHQGELPKLQHLIVMVQGPIAEVQLNRPAKKNAVNAAMTSDWEQLNRWLAGHPEVRVVILSGAGNDFCAGDDVLEVETLTIEQARELSYRQARMYLAWEQLPQLFVAAIQGVAYGAGCVAACAADFRIASHNSTFAMPEIKLGWPPGYGIAQLTALVGKAHALDLCCFGEPISAQIALERGLVHRVVPAGSLLPTARTMAQQLLRLPAEALRETKRVVHGDEGVQPKNAYLNDTAAYVRTLAMPDAREAMRAFREKRSPKFGK